MSDELPAYYWDACIFLEYLRNEQVSALKRQAILRILEQNKKGQNVIFTSAVSHLECLPKKLTGDDVGREAVYKSMFGTRFFYDVPIDAQTIALARDIRDFYFKEADPKSGENHKMMGLGDAIHLAAAIIGGASEMHTRDGNKKRGNIPLLGLAERSPGGKIAGKWELKIVSPEDDQTDIVILAEESARHGKGEG